MSIRIILLITGIFLHSFINAQEFKDALAVGTDAPPIAALNQNREHVELDSILEYSDAVALVFYRGSWCGYCAKHLSVLQDSLQELTSRNVSVLVVSPETSESALKMVKETGATFDILHDADYRIMRDYHVDYKISEETVPKWLGPVTKRTAEANGNDDGMLPIPATYLIGSDGKILWSHFDPDYSQRSSVYQIIQHLPEQ